MVALAIHFFFLSWCRKWVLSHQTGSGLFQVFTSVLSRCSHSVPFSQCRQWRSISFLALVGLARSSAQVVNHSPSEDKEMVLGRELSFLQVTIGWDVAIDSTGFSWGMPMPHPSNMIALCPVVGPKTGARAFAALSCLLPCYVCTWLVATTESGSVLSFPEDWHFLWPPLEQKAQILCFWIITL